MRCKILQITIAGFLTILIFSTQQLYGQQTVSGTVTDAQSGETLPGVNVVLKGSTAGTATDSEGNYEFNVPSLSDTLVFSFVGYESQVIPVNSRSQIDVKMEMATGSLDEILVVGYTDMSQRRTTSSISTINETEFQSIPSTNPIQAMQGKMAGVSVPVLTGQPGAGANIVIRGGTTLRPYGFTAGGRDVSSIDPSDPLVIVDGVFRSIDDINPNDIASIQVMKDAASTAIYGARGANGVIVVTTKSGEGAGEPSFTFNYEYGVDIPNRQYDYLNAKEYLNLARRTVANCENNSDACDSSWLFNGPASQSIYLYSEPGQYGRSTFYTASLENLIDIEGQTYVDDLLQRGWQTMDDPVSDHTIIFKDSQYQDVVWQTAPSSDFNFGVKGSTDDVNYNLSLGYNDQGGTFIGTAYQRFSALANTGYQVNDKVHLNLNLSYLWNDDKYSDNIVRDLTRGVRVPPLTRQYYDDGTPALGEGNNPRNRLHQLYYQDYNRNTDQFVVRLAADYQILPTLQLRPSVSLNTNNYTRRDFEAFYPAQPQPRDKYQRVDENQQIMIDNVLQYTNTFREKHNLMGLVGFNFTRSRLYRVIAQSQRAATDYINTITGDPQTSIVNEDLVANMDAHSFFQEELSASYFSQVSYDFDNRYLFGASLRYDGFSNFAPENRYALFPSVSVGWNISNESFWGVNVINHLKLRSSWGEAGLSNLSINDTFGIFGSSTYASSPGVTRSNLANPNLKWETTETLDMGFDMNLFNDRLSIILDVYNKLTKDRLASLPLPGETGFGSITDNIGELRNRGFEIELQANIIRTNTFNWNSNFSFAFNRKVITKLPDNGKDKNLINGGQVYDPGTGEIIEVGGWAEGERPDGLWAYYSNGIFATDEEAQEAPIDMARPGINLDKPKSAGDVDWADLNNDGIINGLDLVFMGYRVPDKIGGMQNAFTYKGLTMRFVIDFAMGHVISNGALARAMGQGRSYNEGAPRLALSDQTWQQPGDTGKKYPRFSFGDADVGQRNHLRRIDRHGPGYIGVGLDNAYGHDNSIYYSKGDWLAFRELSFSYDLPQSLVKRLRMNKITLNTGVYNLGYISAYDGLNPEQYKGYDEGGYPRPLRFNLGASFNF